MLKSVLKILGFFIVGMVGGIFAEEILWPYFVERPLFYQYKLEKPPIYITEIKELRIEKGKTFREAFGEVFKEPVEKVEKTVVGIETKTKTGKTKRGSGFILTADGLVVTLADLIPENGKVSVIFEGEKVPFQVLKKDPKTSLALIKIERGNLPTTAFSDFGKIKLGKKVFLIGVSFEEGKFKKFFDEGIIKSFDENKIETNIQPSKEILGTPLFDIEGNLLGINYLSKEGNIISIPVTHIRSFAGI
jgi:S1-C subfamily serine protease